MFLYLIKSAICLVLLLGFYHLVLERERMHHFNRFFLIGSIIFSFIVPSFMITVSNTHQSEKGTNQAQIMSLLTEDLQTNKTVLNELTFLDYSLGLSLIISIILLIIFIKNIYKIVSKTKQNEQLTYYDATVVLLKEKILPHSFLQYIFIAKKDYLKNTEDKLILTHELAHVAPRRRDHQNRVRQIFHHLYHTHNLPRRLGCGVCHCA